MRKAFGIALFAIVAGLFIGTPAANAQSVDFRVGVGNNHGWGHRGGGVSVDIHIGDRHRGPIYRDNRGCDHRYGNCGPVYRDNRGCGDYRGGCNGGYGGYDYRPQSINVIVIDFQPVYDRYGRYCGDRRVERYVTAYWDHQRGGYWYTDRHGNYVPAR